MAINYYYRIYGRYGIAAILFLFKSKFKSNKSNSIFVKNLKHPITLSNYKCDVTTLFQIFFAGEYDFELEDSPSTIIDCGANIGLSAIFFANKYKTAQIIAIEPDAVNFGFLKLNTKDYKNIVCLKKAVWSSSIKLNMVDPGIGSWGFQTEVSVENTPNNIDSITIDEIMFDFDLKGIDLLKIDIEAAEKELFSKNYENWLSKTNAIAIELHDFIDPSISTVFLNAIEPYHFKTYKLGENLICEKQHSTLLNY